MNLRTMIDLQSTQGDLARLKTLQAGGPGSGRHAGDSLTDTKTAILKYNGWTPGKKDTSSGTTVHIHPRLGTLIEQNGGKFEHYGNQANQPYYTGPRLGSGKTKDDGVKTYVHKLGNP